MERSSEGVLRAFCQDESGATSIEYALILILCSTAMIAALYNVRDTLNGLLGSIATALEQAL